MQGAQGPWARAGRNLGAKPDLKSWSYRKLGQIKDSVKGWGFFHQFWFCGEWVMLSKCLFFRQIFNPHNPPAPYLYEIKQNGEYFSKVKIQVIFCCHSMQNVCLIDRRKRDTVSL
jgi:hypothetical protein